jgi:hypothetical protein
MDLKVTGNESGLIGHVTVYETAFGLLLHMDIVDDRWSCAAIDKTDSLKFVFRDTAGKRIAAVSIDTEVEYESLIKSDDTNCTIYLIKQEQIDEAVETAQPAAQYLP